MVVDKSWWRGKNGSYCLRGTKDEKVLEMDGVYNLYNHVNVFSASELHT